ncbi:hypothetical protein ABEV55_16230 [Aneurinibacillus thermoaerophilus]|jgi:hypothetical protein|uniref:hypothetical protein n=1 Tax=Aneurinibacillus thermoaerophilus TaxID=143495 RepID=UPI002E218FAC|nr:hypothetical protein [Aneurinibacillus thermoaerophilus]
MELKRVEIRWDKIRSLENFIPEKIQSCHVQLRPNRYNPSFAASVFTDIRSEDVRHAMTQLQHMLGGRALSLQFYYKTDNVACKKNLLPIGELERLGFVHKEQFIWCFEHPDFSIAAIGIPSFTESEWVLQINKRNGEGVPVSACDYSSLFHQQLSLFGNEVIAS